MKRLGEIFGCAISMLAAMALAVAPAQAEVAFSPPQTLFSNIAGSQEIEVDASGRVTVVALKAPPDEDGTLVQVVQLSPTGMPGTVHTLEEVPHDPPLAQCICPELAVDPAGRAVVAWETATDEGRRVSAAFIGADGVPHPPRVLSPGGENALRPSVQAAPDGSFAVAWQVEGVESRVEAALFDPEGNTSESHTVAEPARSPMVAASADGTFHVAWNEEDRVSTTVLDEEGAAETTQAVSPEGEPAILSGIVVDGKGRATIGWWRGSGSYEAKVVRLDTDGTPGTVWTLQPEDQNVLAPKLAVDDQDRVTAVWEDFKERIFTVRLDANGVPEVVHQLSQEGHIAGGPQLAAAQDGRVVVVWSHPARFFIPGESCGVTELEPEDDVVRAAMIDSDGSLVQVYDVSAYGEEAVGPDVALDPLGLPWVTWETYDGTYFCETYTSRVQISHGLEPEPPAEAPVEPSTPPMPGPTSTAPTLRLAKRAVAKDGRVRIKANCLGESGSACSGSVRILVRESALPRLKNVRPRQTETVALARGRYQIAAGRVMALKLPIPKAMRRFLAARQSFWIAATAESQGLSSRSLLIRVVSPLP